MSDLNTGQGRCQGQARLLIRPVRAAIELGAAPDVLGGALRAVHHANRHGSTNDFIAVAFPAMHKGRETILAGEEIELIGSEASLGRLINLEGIQILQRRGMIEDLEIGETFFDEGETGSAYIRDHSAKKHTAGWIRRSQARAARRGKPVGKSVAPQKNNRDALVLRHGDAVLHVREVTGTYTAAPLMVSTYGLSNVSNPAILPVISNTHRGPDDAT